MKPLEKEFEYYVANQEDLVKNYKGKYIVIKNAVVLGAYDDILKAIEETSKKEKPGTFLVQKCDPGKEGYSQTYHSRVKFA